MADEDGEVGFASSAIVAGTIMGSLGIGPADEPVIDDREAYAERRGLPTAA